MLRYILVPIFYFLVFAASSQNITLQGKVVDEQTGSPLESATIYLTRISDSSVVDYTLSDKSGTFKLTTRKIEKPSTLKVSFISYQVFESRIDELAADKDFGTIKLLPGGNELDEVTIKTEAPPVRVKNDTLEFNASSFKLRPDANVEALLKQLPGIEIDQDGAITHNGKPVNQVLVNGKPFFGSDGKIALQNLPSDIINKVQVTELKTKAEEISGKPASSDAASINLTIDKDKNKGLFGKATAGYGTDDRYESSLLFNYFKDERKISVLGSSNNINSVGFSMNEVFDNMGGGRNRSVWINDSEGSFGINGMNFGGGRGITTTNLFGANYADVWRKDADVGGSYFYTDSQSRNVNRTKQVNFLPDGIFITESSSRTNNSQLANNYSAQLEYKIDSTTMVVVEPKLVKSKSSSRSSYQQISTDENDQILNESVSENVNESDNMRFSNSFYLHKSFKRKGRAIGLLFDNNNQNNFSRSFQNSENTFYTDENDDGSIDAVSEDDRNQYRRRRNVSDRYNIEFEYEEPITDSLQFQTNFEYTRDSSLDDRRTFDFDPENLEYSILNDSLSMFVESDLRIFSPRIALQLNKKKVTLTIGTGTEVHHLSARSLYLSADSRFNKKYVFANYDARFSYRFSRTKNLWLSYDYRIAAPSAVRVLPVEDLSDPLNTVVGNPNLKPNESHYLYLNFRDFDFATRSGYSFNLSGTYYNNQAVPYVTYEESRRRRTTYENLSGTYNFWFSGNYNKSIKREAHAFRAVLSLHAAVNHDKGFADTQLYESDSFVLTPKISLNYDYGELLTINPVYRFSYSDSRYTNYVISKASNVVHTFSLLTTSYWPKNVVFGNDVSYTFNSNIADGFRKDFLLWNVSLGYNFFGEKLLAKVKVYDLLNQNQSNTRTITPTSVRDEENIVLQRYAMFSLTYKLEKFAGKKESGRRFH